ncbi:MAG: hypothetical protein MI754_06705 [Chromatiales bacterium]|nr:hypothetical protein [Chromatiales bacterium]
MTSTLISSFSGLSRSKRRQRITRDNLKQLLEKLDGKADYLNKQLKTETDKTKLSRLKIELQVLNAQRNKGSSILNQT